MEAGICLALFFMVSHIIILLLDDGWMKAEGYIDSLKEIYSAIYQGADSNSKQKLFMKNADV